ncbi:hypothetical protein D3C81_1627040 [compost metagenome]
MGILVDNGALLQQMARFRQHLQNHAISLFIIDALEARSLCSKLPLVIHRRQHTQIVALTHGKVVLTMSGSRMHTAGACFQRNMLAQDHQGIPVIDGMAAYHMLQLGADKGGFNSVLRPADFLGRRFQKTLRQHILLACGINQRIFVLGMQGNAQVSRQGPWCCGPNNQRSGFRQLAFTVLHLEGHINGWGGFFLVLNFGFS